MRCPYCNAKDTRVLDSRDVNDGDAVRRRRACESCQRRFTTYERVESVALVVVKKDGRREEFDPAKLRKNVRLSLTKRPVSEDDLDALIMRIESRLTAVGTREVASAQIGEAVLAELKELDQIAYIRFASVYREFRDVSEFVAELGELGDQ